MTVHDRLGLEAVHHPIQGLHVLGLVASEGVSECVVKGFKRTRFDHARRCHRRERRTPVLIGRLWQAKACAKVSVDLLASGIRGIDRQPPARESAEVQIRGAILNLFTALGTPTLAPVE
ncbi:hypothetical protein ACFOHK_03730 [Falsigemmobacter intermedius]|uniref:Uncharacterized protein n=1 Tax=Falsigemmobacter intermedius TaxID=1553448 RepID=A0A451GH08_9RHOB|nr:hypothetical protein EP867_17505 [Falsigemmobacter intermedius]